MLRIILHKLRNVPVNRDFCQNHTAPKILSLYKFEAPKISKTWIKNPKKYFASPRHFKSEDPPRAFQARKPQNVKMSNVCL